MPQYVLSAHKNGFTISRKYNSTKRNNSEEVNVVNHFVKHVGDV